MKNLVVTLLGCMVFASCTKTKMDQEVATTLPSDLQSCDFGFTSFNLVKRAPVNTITDDAIFKRPRSGGGGTTTPPPTGAGLIYLDFNGQIVTGTPWNTNGDITCAPANLTADEMSQVVSRVAGDYSPFNITITTDEALFNASTAKKMRVIITESWEWYGQTGGAAFISTLAVGSTIPCFVFSSLLGYSPRGIAEATSHESGHTIGLYHQSSYSGSTKTAEYNAGQGTGEIGWAPIMGNSYSKNLSLWHKGPTNTSASTIQDDVAMITTVVGTKTDDHSNAVSAATPLTSSIDALINSSTDVDYFSVNLAAASTITLTPFNFGLYNAGANLDLVLKIYNSQGILIATVNDALLLNAATVVTPGTYYVSVGTTSNAYTTIYGMLGKYNLRIN